MNITYTVADLENENVYSWACFANCCVQVNGGSDGTYHGDD